MERETSSIALVSECLMMKLSRVSAYLEKKGNGRMGPSFLLKREPLAIDRPGFRWAGCAHAVSRCEAMQAAGGPPALVE